jgi:nucleoside 2-deoxyribosyltransferase
MPRCFVIQPFDDGGPYDKRYWDILAPAIKDADLEPYRVDEDRSVSVPIDDIEKNIEASEICLADITLDNANIWYEVGYAFANDKPVVMVCGNAGRHKIGHN